MTLDDRELVEDVCGDWWTESASPKAWMSVRDADLLEALLHRQALEHDPLRVLEWGGGRSTCWYPRYLQTLGRRYLWVTVEHDQAYCDRELVMRLPPGARVCRLGSASVTPSFAEPPSYGLWVYAFD